MHFLVISSPSPAKPSTIRDGQKAFWDWLHPLLQDGSAKHVYAKLGRGAVIIFNVDSHETLHKLLNQWSECVPAHFEVTPLIPAEHQERIARAGLHPNAV